MVTVAVAVVVLVVIVAVGVGVVEVAVGREALVLGPMVCLGALRVLPCRQGVVCLCACVLLC